MVPRDSRVLSNAEMYYSMDGPQVAPAGQGGLNQRLLSMLVNWYQSLANPGQIDDDALLVSADSQRADVNTPAAVLLASLQPLIASSSPIPHIVGLTGAIRLGSTPAVATLVGEVSTLRSNSRFALIEGALQSYPQAASSLPLLQQLVGLGAPGLDAAAGTAIEKIGGKAIIPIMVSLLDSPDSMAQLRAIHFLGRYSIFADAQGNMASGGPNGPLFDKGNLIYMSPSGGAVTVAQCVAFWKSWWSSHSSSLGF